MKLAKLGQSRATINTLRPTLKPEPINYGRGRGGRPWRRKRDAVMARDQWLCQCDTCKAEGRLTEAQEVDHIIPVWKGGSDELSNLRAINRDCHKAKTARESAEAMRAITVS